MKQILILLFAVVTTSNVQAQKLKESEVPAPVKKAFMQKFPKAKDAKWEKEDATAIEAEFKMDNSEYSAKFDLEGKWLETEMEVDKKQLPAAILATIAKEFSDFKIEEAEKVETPGNDLVYELELEKKEITYEVQFNKEGKVLKKELVKEKEEKD